MQPIAALTIAPQALGIDPASMGFASGAIGMPPSMGSGLSVAGMQRALSLKTPLAGTAFQESVQMPKALDPTSAALALNPAGAASGSGRSDAEILKVSKDFEAIFLRMLMQEMRDTVQKSGLMGNSRAMQFFESMYDEQVAEQLAQAGGVGFGDLVYQQLKQSTNAHLRTTS